MSRIEELLAQMSLRAPSEELDQRVAGTVTPAIENRRQRPSWWGMLAACSACLMVGLVAGYRLSLGQVRAVSTAPDVPSTDMPETPATEADESTLVSTASDPGGRPPDDAAPDATAALDQEPNNGATPDQRTLVTEGSFLLINGQPARRHRTFWIQRVRRYNESTDQFEEIEVPIRRDVVIQSPGI